MKKLIIISVIALTVAGCGFFGGDSKPADPCEGKTGVSGWRRNMALCTILRQIIPLPEPLARMMVRLVSPLERLWNRRMTMRWAQGERQIKVFEIGPKDDVHLIAQES